MSSKNIDPKIEKEISKCEENIKNNAKNTNGM